MSDTDLLTQAGARPDGTTDCSDAFEAVLADLPTDRRFTLRIPDGTFLISRTLTLGQHVSLDMSPGATIRAAEGFDGEAMVELASYRGEKKQATWDVRVIRGGVLDGHCQPVVGLRVINDRETDLIALTVRNCLRKGIHVGVQGDCEVNCRGVRVQCEREVVAEAGSIGIHYENCTDSLVTQAIVIGYETGVRSDSSSNDFHQIHVWNYQANCPLVTCFYCNGWNDSYHQCYADSPMNADDIGYGFFVARPFQRIIGCRVYNNFWTTPGKVVGIEIAKGATHGTYVGNHFTARAEHDMGWGIRGDLVGACAVGNTYAQTVQAGRINVLPGNLPDDAVNCPMAFDADRLALLRPMDAIPADSEGRVGEIGWVSGADGTFLVLRTPEGWKRATLS